ncbi:MAG: hypothetical protein KME17_08480 [Cyanosarcina radialis HA8281-LM2]|jgi:hypothetical protein|nr:hypothetical protein [Cyanosarcina radialis HA8281-LM2]
MKISWQNAVFIAVLMGVAVVPVVGQVFTPKILSALYIDVSDSNQKNASAIAEICRDRLTHLIDGDYLLDGKFADLTYVTNSQEFAAQENAARHKECQLAIAPPSQVGKQRGTDIIKALQNLKIETQNLKNYRQIRATFLFNSLEPTADKAFNEAAFLKELKQAADELNSPNYSLIFIGADASWQAKLKQTLKDNKNVRVCAYESGVACQNAAYAAPRK